MAQLSALKKFEYKEKRKLPTGIDPLDTILNNGPEEGDLICLSSKQGGGKSTMLLMLSRIYIEEYGMKVCYLDVERGVKHEIMDNMGLTKYRESGDFYITNQVNTYTDASELLEEILNRIFDAGGVLGGGEVKGLIIPYFINYFKFNTRKQCLIIIFIYFYDSYLPFFHIILYSYFCIFIILNFYNFIICIKYIIFIIKGQTLSSFFKAENTTSVRVFLSELSSIPIDRLHHAHAQDNII